MHSFSYIYVTLCLQDIASAGVFIHLFSPHLDQSSVLLRKQEGCRIRMKECSSSSSFSSFCSLACMTQENKHRAPDGSSDQRRKEKKDTEEK